MIILKVIFLITLCLVLAFSTKIFQESLEKITKIWGIDGFVFSSIMVAFGTSLPELVISVDAAIKGNTNLALGNILGSNIADISIIIGGACLIVGSVLIPKNIHSHEIYYTFLITSTPLAMLSDGKISRVEGVLLVFIYATWQMLTLKNGKRKRNGIFKIIRVNFFNNFSLRKELTKFLASLVILLIAAEAIVKTSLNISNQFNIPELIIGIFILGAGSSLPELAFGISALRKDKPKLILGDILGSLVANSSIILGIACIISPVHLFYPQQFLKSTLYFLAIFLIFYLFIRSKDRLEKWEGAFLVASYIIILALEIP